MSDKKNLFESSDEGEDDDFTVNQEYADKFSSTKRTLELATMRQKFGSQEDDYDDYSFSDETSDEDGYMMSDKKRIEIAKVVKAIKKKDKAAMEEPKHFYDSDSGSSTDGGYDTPAHSKGKRAPYTLKQQLIDALDTEDPTKLAMLYEEQDEADPNKPKMTPAAEREAAKADFLHVMAEADNSQSWEVKAKTKEELQAEAEVDDKFWASSKGKALTRNIQRKAKAYSEMEDLFADMDTNNPQDAFLKDFFCGEGWSWTKAGSNPLNAHAEARSKREEESGNFGVDSAPLKDESSGDEEFDKNQECFEHAYEEIKYRHQEPGFDKIANPGNVTSSLRREEPGKRARERERRKNATEARQREHEEELKQMKALKKAEIEEKNTLLSQLREVAGTKLDSFDPKTLAMIENGSMEEYDKAMAKIFDDEYYNEDDEEDLEELSDWDSEKEEEEVKRMLAEAGEDVNSPGEESEEEEEEEEEEEMEEEMEKKKPESKKESKKEKKESKKQEVKQKEKPSANSKALDISMKRQALEADIEKDKKELESMGYEDVIANGTIKTRFKYKKVEPFQFGFDETDILVLPDETLDAICPMRMLGTHRSHEERQHDKKIVKYRMKQPIEIDWKQEKPRKKKYRAPSGIDPSTWDEIKNLLDTNKAKAEEEKKAELEEAGYAADDGDKAGGNKDKKKKKRKREGEAGKVEKGEVQEAVSEETKKKKKKKA